MRVKQIELGLQRSNVPWSPTQKTQLRQSDNKPVKRCLHHWARKTSLKAATTPFLHSFPLQGQNKMAGLLLVHYPELQGCPHFPRALWWCVWRFRNFPDLHYSWNLIKCQSVYVNRCLNETLIRKVLCNTLRSGRSNSAGNHVTIWTIHYSLAYSRLGKNDFVPSKGFGSKIFVAKQFGENCEQTAKRLSKVG